MTLLDTLANGGGRILSRNLSEAGFANQVGTITCEPGMRFGFFGAVCEDPAWLNTMAKVRGAMGRRLRQHLAGGPRGRGSRWYR